MPPPPKAKQVDADTHINEPYDLWEKNVESKYRDRCLRFRRNAEGLEYIEIEGKPRPQSRPGTTGLWSGPGGYPDPDGDFRKLFKPGVYSYQDTIPPAAQDPHERVKLMDKWQVDANVIFPTLSLAWEENVEDPELTLAMCRVYNDWITAFCKSYPERLIPVAHIPIHNVTTAIEEVKRSAKLGARAFYLRCDIVNGRTLASPDFDPLYAVVQDLDLPVALHTVIRSNAPMQTWIKALAPGKEKHFVHNDTVIFAGCYLMLELQAAMTAMLTNGVFERFPRLRCALIEAGGGWIAYWLERLDDRYKIASQLRPMGEKPSFYFKRNCLLCFESQEATVPEMVRHVGEDSFCIGSDFPHFQSEEFGIIRSRMDSLPAAGRDKILGENARRFFRIP